LKKVHPSILSVLSAFILFAAWPVSPFTPLIFLGFVPLLWISELGLSRPRFFGWIYLSLLLWNGATTWWTCNSTVPGGLAAIFANALLMSVPWIGFYNVKRRMGNPAGYTSLVAFWLCFEFIHLNWELSWPWLTLGNVFATHPRWIQWYEYTGVAGGSLWVLGINLVVFGILQKYTQKSLLLRLGVILVAALVLPLAISQVLARVRAAEMREDSGQRIANVVIVQPNVDPWDDKFAAGKQEAQLSGLIHLSLSQMDSGTRLVVWPETAIPVAINEDSMKTSYFLLPVWDFLKKHPDINLLTGVEGFRFLTEAKKTAYSQKIPGSPLYGDGYNSAVLMDSTDFLVYHKSKLVPGAEVLPSFLRFLEPIFEKFGATTGSYAKQTERTVLRTFNHSYAIAPAVCYESIYGEFMGRYVRGGASLIAIITDDGWWGNTPGYRQHENYARLRSIETRRWIVRSANTGISCFIDPLGAVIDPQPWDKATAIKLNVPQGSRMTYYVTHGDILFKLATALTLIILLWNLVVLLKSTGRRG
jgi:apolipoprotein N-acyltransferase